MTRGMSSIDRKTAYAFTVLRADEHFQRVREWIEQAAQADLKDMAQMRDMEDIRVFQGRYRALSDLLKMMDNAPDIYEHLKGQR